MSNLLTPLLPTDHCASETFSFLESFKEVSKNNKFMISFDVESLFTSIPLNETINLADDLIHSRIKDLDISKIKLKKPFIFATKQKHFSFDNVIYDQIDGLPWDRP